MVIRARRLTHLLLSLCYDIVHSTSPCRPSSLIEELERGVAVLYGAPSGRVAVLVGVAFVSPQRVEQDIFSSLGVATRGQHCAGDTTVSVSRTLFGGSWILAHIGTFSRPPHDTRTKANNRRTAHGRSRRPPHR